MIIEDQCLGLVRSLGLAEWHSVNLRLGGRFRRRISSEARISAFLYRYRIAFLASRTHKPTTHLKTKISETDSIIDKEPGWTWSHQWRDSRSECSSGLWFRLGYPRSKSPQTTKTLTLLEIPESTVHFGLTSPPTLCILNIKYSLSRKCYGPC